MSTERLLRRAAREIEAGQVINLGIGLPTRLMAYLPADFPVLIHSENGVLGCGPVATRAAADPRLIDAGGAYITTRPGASYFDSATSFALVRRGRLDLSVMGAFEVDEQGNLANWKIPGRFSPGIGGAMELAQKTPRVLILCSHNDKQGRPKILRRCSLPLTAERCVSRIITDKAVIDVTPAGLRLREVAEGLDSAAVQACTGAELLMDEPTGVF
jgi:3-oxoacid CoA-transferase B subunit